MLQPETERWASGRARLVELQRDTEAYWRLLAELWTSADGDLVIVEHDMVPAPGVVDRMLACGRPWCTSPYPVTEWQTVVIASLGCTRFAERLRHRHPDLMVRLGEIGNDGLPARDWRRLDVRLAPLLLDRGYKPHTHARSRHLHDYTRGPV